MLEYIVERLEEQEVILETQTCETCRLPRKELPGNLKEGMVLNFSEGRWFINEEATRQRRNIMERKLEKVFGKRRTR